MADELEKIRALAMAEVGDKMWGWFYLSWADEDKWLGGAYVLAYGPITARLRCSALRINPGGQCMVIRLPDSFPPPALEYRNRLLNREQILEVDPNAKTLGELRKEKKPTHPKLKNRYPE